MPPMQNFASGRRRKHDAIKLDAVRKHSACGRKMSRAADRSRSSASRQRRHHQRVVNGRCVVAVEIDDVRVPEILITYGFLAADAGENRAEIGRASRD